MRKNENNFLPHFIVEFSLMMTINHFLTLIPKGYCLVHTNIIKGAIDSKDWKDSFSFHCSNYCQIRRLVFIWAGRWLAQMSFLSLLIGLEA